jgi:hypothetical protein
MASMTADVRVFSLRAPQGLPLSRQFLRVGLDSLPHDRPAKHPYIIAAQVDAGTFPMGRPF